MPTITDLSSAIGVLKEYLEEHLQSDLQFQIHPEQEPPFVDVVLLTDEPTASEQVGLAYVLLSGTDERFPEWGHTARRATIAAPCKASDYAGGKTGAENPDAIQTKMAQRIAQIVEDDYAVLRDMGLLNIKCAFGRGGQTNDREPNVTTQELTISFVFLTS